MEYLIPHYGSVKLLKRAVKSVLLTDQTARVFIGDDSHELTEKDFNDNRVHIINGPNKGFAGNVNNLVKVAQGDWVVIMNNDVVLAKDWYPIMSEELNSVQESTYCLASSIFKNNGQVDSFGDSYSWYGQGFNRFHLLVPKVKMYQKARVLGASGALMLIRRKVFLRYKLSTQLGSYCEDTALHLQANNDGFKSWYIPAARATHLGSATFGLERKLSLSARNSILVIRSVFAGRLRNAFLKRAYIYWKTKALVSKKFRSTILNGVSAGLRDRPFKVLHKIENWPKGLYLESMPVSSFRLAKQLLGGRLVNRIRRLFDSSSVVD